MHRSDWPSFSGFAAPALPSLPSIGAAAMAMPTAGQQALAYTPLGHAVAREVQQFIQQGGGAAAGLASPQAQWMSMQAARQLQHQDAQSKQAPAFATGGAAALRGAAQRERTQAAEPSTPPTPLKPEQQAFLQRIGPWAEQAAAKLGVSVRSVMAHAALESGWGQRPVRAPDGRDTLNLFGFKAMGGWSGDSVQAMTTEYGDDGQPVKQPAAFRAYADLDSTFADYVRLLGHSPRYRDVRNTGEDVHAFAHALVQGGYATDPAYADKLVRLSRSIPSAP